MKILFVFNPRAGAGNNEPYLEKIISYCKNNRLDYKIYTVSKEKHEKELEEEISSYKPDAIIACGGDGTVNFVGSIVMGKDILFSIIPLGSANGLATALGLKRDIIFVLEKVQEGKFSKMDVLLLNSKFNCFHLSSVGFNAQLVKKYEKANSKGMWGYARHFISTLLEKKPMSYTFQLNGTTISKHADMVTFANAKKYGTGAIINPDGKIDDGKFEICIFRPFPVIEIFRMAYYFFFGNLKRSPLVKIVRTSKVVMTCKEKRTLEIDGDLVGEFDKISVEVQKGALKMIAGEVE